MHRSMVVIEKGAAKKAGQQSLKLKMKIFFYFFAFFWFSLFIFENVQSVVFHMQDSHYCVNQKKKSKETTT